MSPSFFQTMGVLQSKVEEELEFLDVRSSGPMQLGNGVGGVQGAGLREEWDSRGLQFSCHKLSPLPSSWPAPRSSPSAMGTPGSP